MKDYLSKQPKKSKDAVILIVLPGSVPIPELHYVSPNVEDADVEKCNNAGNYAYKFRFSIVGVFDPSDLNVEFLDSAGVPMKGKYDREHPLRVSDIRSLERLPTEVGYDYCFYMDWGKLFHSICEPPNETDPPGSENIVRYWDFYLKFTNGSDHPLKIPEMLLINFSSFGETKRHCSCGSD